MLSACMIDGFGWFKDADYRRSWLFFDSVDYILPVALYGRLQYPDDLTGRPDFTMVRPRSNPDTLDYVIEQSRVDFADADYCRLVRSTVPKKDLDYAMWVVLCDGELRTQLHRIIRDPVFCLAYLVNKLLVYSSLSGALPIFGRDYATNIVVYKLEAWSKLSSRQKTGALVTPNQAVSLSAFAAGLSLSFISDDDLSGIPIEDLAKFKERCFPLLQKHQVHLIDTSHAFHGIPSGEDFQRHLAGLRFEAKKQRLNLDEEMRESWLSAGLSKAMRVAISSAGLLGSALGLVKLAGPTSRIGVPLVLAGLGMAGGMEGTGSRPHANTGISSGMLYLFEAQKYFAGNDPTPPPREAAETLAIRPVSVQVPMRPQPSPTLASLRRLVALALPSDADLVAFCLDYFPSVGQRFGDNMDRLSKVNILLQNESPENILKCLRLYAHEVVQKNEHLLEY